MKKVGFALVIAVAALGPALALSARAADVPTKKETPAAPPPNCFSSFWAYMNSTAADCPLSYGPLTVYATIDTGFGYNTNGANWNPSYANGVASAISKQGYGAKWQQVPNGINQSVLGLKLSQPIGWGWSIVGTVETAADPYSLWIANGQHSQVMNNGKGLLQQNYNSDSSRSGQWDNSQGFVGLSNKTYGTLVFGRVNSLSLDGLIGYDPMGSAYAFSAFGFSGQYAGFGDTEIGRSNTAFKYRGEFGNFRVGALAQIGSYNQGNGSTQLWQGQVGADFNLFGAKLSFDAIGNYAENAVSTSTFTGTCSIIKSGSFNGQASCTSGIPNFYSTDDLKATLSNNTGTWLLGKYKLPQFPLTISGGWGWWRLANPSDDFSDGFKTIGGYNVPANITGNKAFPTVWVTSNAYNVNRIFNMFFIGGKYAVTDQIDVAAAYYYGEQNNYNSSSTPCAYANTNFVQPNGHSFEVSRINNAACAGSADFLSFMIDYRPVKRVDIYAGVMLSNVYAGLANGYPATQSIAPTAGLRVKF